MFAGREEIEVSRGKLRRWNGFSREGWPIDGRAPGQDWWRMANRSLIFGRALWTSGCVILRSLHLQVIPLCAIRQWELWRLAKMQTWTRRSKDEQAKT